MRILAVDPGEKHIGVAISDPSELLARPLTTLRHVARAKDAAHIVALADENEAGLILVGHPLDSEGQPGPQARHAGNLADAIRALTALPVEMVDESFSSLEAQAALRSAGKNRRARHEQIHAAAAAAILQGYLDGHPREAPEE
jgi:putative Holliday junction resolvase